MRTDKDLFGYLYRRLTGHPHYVFKLETFNRNNGFFNRNGMYGNREFHSCSRLEVYYEFSNEVRQNFSGTERPDRYQVEFMFYVRIPYATTNNSVLTEQDAITIDNMKGVLEQSIDIVDGKERLPYEGCSQFSQFRYLREMLVRPNSNHCVYIQNWDCQMQRTFPDFTHQETKSVESTGILAQITYNPNEPIDA